VQQKEIKRTFGGVGGGVGLGVGGRVGTGVGVGGGVVMIGLHMAVVPQVMTIVVQTESW
jgi:hypothetical protein